ncbi:MAG: CPBP family glutamic-type intramembrane protease [Candidatus Marinimicrobia bacterium]|nr:CPBP family glutamic-type intramembrane protease [Candidatus Neomarinimicrobiota bacterium]
MVLKQTKSPLLSFIAVLPLVVIYEVVMFIRFYTEPMAIRNGADILLKRLLSEIGFYGLEASIVLFLLVFILVKWIHNIHFKESELHLGYIPVMIGESLIYALVIFYILIHLNVPYTPINPQDHELSIAYSCGAGVYEELVFRALLMYGFYKLVLTIGKNKGLAWGVAILLSTGIFVSLHYIGEFKYPFAWNTFLVRFAVSLILSVIFIFRGFAVAAYTHTFYNLSLIYLGGLIR